MKEMRFRFNPVYRAQVRLEGLIRTPFKGGRCQPRIDGKVNRALGLGDSIDRKRRLEAGRT